MADYEFRYRLNQAPEARNDGSGLVSHDIDAVSRVQGSSDEFVSVPGRHKTILVPATDLLTVMGMADGGAKVTAYKNLLAQNLNTSAVPVVGWDATSLEAMLDANDKSLDAMTQANAYIIANWPYPVTFSF